MANTAQIRKIRAMVSSLHLDDDAYRKMLENVTGKTSSKDLSNEQVSDVVKHLARVGAPDTTVRDRKRPRLPNATALRTEAQVSLIRTNYMILSWNSEAQHIGFNKRSCGKSWPQTRSEATKVIVGQGRYAATVIERWSGVSREEILHSDRLCLDYSHSLARDAAAAAGDEAAIAQINAARLLLIGKLQHETARCSPTS